MRLHQLAHDRQAQASAAGRAGTRAVGTVEALEDVRQVLGGDAAAGVAHGDLDLPTQRPARDDDLAGHRVCERVGEQVTQHLADPARIGAHRRQVRRQVGPQRDAGHGRARLGPRDRAGDDAGEVCGRHLHRQLAGLGQRQLLEIVDQVAQQQRLLVERFDDGRRRCRDAVAQRLEVAAQVRQRRAQLVRHVADQRSS